MRIGLINPTILMRRPIAQLAVLLAREGHNVTIITPGTPKTDDVRESDKIIENSPNIIIKRFPSNEIASLLWSYPKYFSFFKDIKKEIIQQDIVHIWAPFYPISFYPLLLKFFKRIRVPLILTFDTFPGYSFHMTSPVIDLALRFFIRVSKSVFNRANTITVYSDMLLPYAKQIGLITNITQTIPTGIIIDKNAKQAISNDSEIVPIILFVGLLNGRKGVDTLLKTAKIIQDKNISCKFLLVGSGPDRIFYENQKDKMKLHNIIFSGSTTEVTNYYKKASIFFLPSRGEGLPGVIMEAMNHGLPIITSDIPCLSDLVKNNFNGFLHNPEQPSEFADSIIYLLRDKKARQMMGDNSKIKIQAFDWEDVFVKYMNLYINTVNNAHNNA